MEKAIKKEVKEESLYENGGVWMRGSWLGNGTYGSVHLAYGFSSSSPRYQGIPSVVAVKSAEISTLEQLSKEKFIYNHLGHSPFLIACFGDDVTESEIGVLYYNLFLEYASGGTLWDLIRYSNGLGLLESKVKTFTRSLLGGINQIHQAGYAHGDLKPGNILLVESETEGLVAKIGDFGSAKNVYNDTDNGVRGTYMYCAPECFGQNKFQGQAADIWALGCIVFSMLTGDLKWFIAPDLWKLSEPIRGISKEAEDFARKCLTKNHTERHTAAMLLSHPFVAGKTSFLVCVEEKEEIRLTLENSSSNEANPEGCSIDIIQSTLDQLSL